MSVSNLGQIAAVIFSSTPPTRTTVLWWDTSQSSPATAFKIYDTTSSSWSTLIDVVNAQANGTDLGINITGSSVQITSSTGLDVTVPVATSSQAGVLSALKFLEIEAATATNDFQDQQIESLDDRIALLENNPATGGLDEVNLSITATNLQVTITNDGGADAVINSASVSQAGVMTSSLFQELKSATQKNTEQDLTLQGHEDRLDQAESDITGLDGRIDAIEQGAGGNGDMTRQVYDSNDDGIVDSAEKVNGVDGATNSTYYGKNATGSVGFFSLPDAISSTDRTKLDNAPLDTNQAIADVQAIADAAIPKADIVTDLVTNDITKVASASTVFELKSLIDNLVTVSEVVDTFNDLPASETDQVNYYVRDASADSTVVAGWAIYKFVVPSGGGSGTWVKVAEQESLDIDLAPYVQIADIVNELVTNSTDRPLSAAQGVILKGLIDALDSRISSLETDYFPRTIADSNINSGNQQPFDHINYVQEPADGESFKLMLSELRSNGSSQIGGNFSGTVFQFIIDSLSQPVRKPELIIQTGSQLIGNLSDGYVGNKLGEVGIWASSENESLLLGSGKLILKLPRQGGSNFYNFNPNGVLDLIVEGVNYSFDFKNPSGDGGTPGGADTQVQYNSSGSFAGSSNLTFDGSTLTSSQLAISGTVLDEETPSNLIYEKADGTLGKSSYDPSGDLVSGSYNNNAGILELTGDVITYAELGDIAFSNFTLQSGSVAVLIVPSSSGNITFSGISNIEGVRILGQPQEINFFEFNGYKSVEFKDFIDNAGGTASGEYLAPGFNDISGLKTFNASLLVGGEGFYINLEESPGEPILYSYRAYKVALPSDRPVESIPDVVHSTGTDTVYYKLSSKQLDKTDETVFDPLRASESNPTVLVDANSLKKSKDNGYFNDPFAPITANVSSGIVTLDFNGRNDNLFATSSNVTQIELTINNTVDGLSQTAPQNSWLYWNLTYTGTTPSNIYFPINSHMTIAPGTVDLGGGGGPGVGNPFQIPGVNTQDGFNTVLVEMAIQYITIGGVASYLIRSNFTQLTI